MTDFEMTESFQISFKFIGHKFACGHKLEIPGSV